MMSYISAIFRTVTKIRDLACDHDVLSERQRQSCRCGLAIIVWVIVKCVAFRNGCEMFEVHRLYIHVHTRRYRAGQL